MIAYFYGSALLLALLLFYPTSRLIWVLSVRRLERRNGRPLEPRARDGQRARAHFIALFVVAAFAWLFTLQLLGNPHE